MENVSKALMMAVGVLIGVVLLTVFVSTITKLSDWTQTQDELKNTEQIAKFNAEYEVYQKSTMYGVDVISCLNKVKNNNEKYVEGGSFLGSFGYGNNYEVNVTIELKTPLSESISVTAYKYNSFSGEYKKATIFENSIIVENNARADLKLKDVFDIDETKQLTSFKADDYLKYEMTKEDSGIEINKVYQLISSATEETKLSKLLEHSNNPRQIVKNSQSPSIVLYNPSVVPPTYGWDSATWSTYLYSFKQKRFKCTNIEYSEKTGYINKLEFKEI